MSVFTLKLIAIISMLTDHIGVIILQTRISDPMLQDIYIISRYIGRTAFPVFAFLVANGCKYTKDIRKYMFRLGCLALISEVIFDLAFSGDISFVYNTNVFYTLFLGVAYIEIYEKMKNKKNQWIALLPIIAIPAILLVNFTPFHIYGLHIAGATIALCILLIYTLAHKLPDNANFGKVSCQKNIVAIIAGIPLLILAELLTTDYGYFGVGLIFLVYLMNPENKLLRSLALSMGAIFHYGGGVFGEVWTEYEGEFIIERFINLHGISALTFALLAAVLVFFYNGKYGTKSAIVKYGFYAFYPIHILFLTQISRLLSGS